MENILKTPIATFSDLSAFIVNTEMPTILAFSQPNTFGRYWLNKMEQHIRLLFLPNLVFRTELNLPHTELSILTVEGGGPVIFLLATEKLSLNL